MTGFNDDNSEFLATIEATTITPSALSVVFDVNEYLDNHTEAEMFEMVAKLNDLLR